MVASFDALAQIDLSHVGILFLVLTACAAVAAVVFVSLGVGDAWAAGPEPSEWWARQWLSDQRVAYWWAKRLAIVSAAVVLSGFGLHFLHTTLSLAGIRILIIVGVGFAVAGGIAGLVRSFHPLEDEAYSESGIRWWEATFSIALLSLYLAALLAFLP